MCWPKPPNVPGPATYSSWLVQALLVYPAAYLPEYAVRAGARLIIVNLTPTHLDARAEVVLRGKAGEIMDQLVRRAGGA